MAVIVEQFISPDLLSDFLDDPEMKKMRLLAMGSYARRALAVFFQVYFQNPHNSDGQFVAVPKDTPLGDNQLRVLDRYTFNNSAGDARPALVVARRSTRRLNWSLGTGMRQKNIRTGETERSFDHAFAYDLIAVARDGVRAELLADLVMGAVNVFNDELRSILGWQSIGAPEMGPENAVLLTPRPDLMTVTVQLTGTMRARYRKTTNANKLSYVITGGVLNTLNPDPISGP